MIKWDNLMYAVPAAIMMLGFIILLMAQKRMSYVPKRACWFALSLAAGWVVGDYVQIYTLLK